MSQGPQFNPSSQPGPGATSWGAGSGPVPPAPGGYPGDGYRPPREQHPEAVAVFVLGLVSVLMLWPLGFLAWIMGNKAMRDVRDRPGVYENENLIVAGRILGIVAAVLTILFAVFFVGMMVLGLTVPLLVAAGIGAA